MAIYWWLMIIMFISYSVYDNKLMTVYYYNYILMQVFLVMQETTSYTVKTFP